MRLPRQSGRQDSRFRNGRGNIFAVLPMALLLVSTLYSALAVTAPESTGDASNPLANATDLASTAKRISTTEERAVETDNERLMPRTDHGVILLYHHVSDSTPRLTSVTVEQFEAHLNSIAEQGFRVIPLMTLLEGIYSGDGVIENAVAITFDDAYESVYQNAFPRLRARGWPFTVFVADQPVDRGFSPFMSWTQMKEMAAAGVTFGGHSKGHEHLVRLRDGQVESRWRNDRQQNLADNRARLDQVLGKTVNALAYPYGEYDAALVELVAAQGLYGLGQHSGAVGAHTPRGEIPRFPMMHSLATLDRLALALNSRPLPIADNAPGDLIRRVNEASDVWRFSLLPGDYRVGELACYSARGDRLPVTITGSDVTVALPDFTPGRNKVNCTAPSLQRSGEYYWQAQQWLVRAADGTWPAEP